MINKKILILAPYPIKSPQHGGQKRVQAIVNYYKKTFKDVRFVPIFHRSHYEFDEKTEFVIGDQKIIKMIDSRSSEIDLIVGRALYDDPHVKNRLANFLVQYRPDIIQIEQLISIQKLTLLLGELGQNPKLIYSSHNIEYKLKESLLKTDAQTVGEKNDIVRAIQKEEKQLASNADLVIAVSKPDAKELESMGAKQTVIVQNGIYKNNATQEAKNSWSKYKAKGNHRQILLFIGSGHPPNGMGFVEMMGRDLTFLPKGVRVFIAGGVSSYLKTKYKLSKNFWGSAEPLGVISEGKLSGLIATSDVIILPISKGGGSNLKTAEAILADTKVVATSYAFRSFEKYLQLPNLYIADTKKDFKEAVLKALSSKKRRRSKEETELAEQVQWSHCLKPLSRAVKKATSNNANEYIRKKLGSLKRKIKRFYQ